MALKLNASVVFSRLNLPSRHIPQSSILRFNPNHSYQSTHKMFCSMDMAAGQSDDPRKINIGHVVHKAQNLWDNSPQPIKSFPWHKTLDNFIQLVLDLIIAVVKYLSVPMFVITSISEMSYCSHEKKLHLILFPFLVGAAVAGVLRDAALESSPYLKNAKVAWHLIAIATFFVLLKFPGPYYPYWGRILIPHFANGALLRISWSMFLWCRRPLTTLENNQPNPSIVHKNRKPDAAQD